MIGISIFSRARRLLADISRFALGATSREASLEQSLADQGARVADLLDERNAARDDASDLAIDRNAYQAFTGSVCETYRDLVKIKMNSNGVWADFTLRKQICEYFKALAESNQTRATRIEELERELMTIRDSLHNAEQLAFLVPGLEERIRELDSLGERWQAERDDARSELEHTKQLLHYSEKHAAKMVEQREKALADFEEMKECRTHAVNRAAVTFKEKRQIEEELRAKIVEQSHEIGNFKSAISSISFAKDLLEKQIAEKNDLCEQFQKRLGQQKSDHERILAASEQKAANYNADLNFARDDIVKLVNERDELRSRLDRLEDGNYVAQFNKMSREVHEWARGKGWWEERDQLSKEATLAGGNEFNRFTNSVIQSSLIALIHSELSEALEAIRHGNPPDDKIPEFTGLDAELADAVIRIHDMAGAYGLRVGEAIEAKMKFNHTREYKHGGKVV